MHLVHSNSCVLLQYCLLLGALSFSVSMALVSAVKSVLLFDWLTCLHCIYFIAVLQVVTVFSCAKIAARAWFQQWQSGSLWVILLKS